jgi:hypothetical protein
MTLSKQVWFVSGASFVPALLIQPAVHDLVHYICVVAWSALETDIEGIRYAYSHFHISTLEKLSSVQRSQNVIGINSGV